MTIILNKEITQTILGKNMDECIELAKDKMDQQVIREMLSNILAAKSVRIKGNVSNDDFGLMMIGSSLEYPELDVKQKAQELLDELEVA